MGQDEEVVVRKATVTNSHGVHARPSQSIVQLATQFDAELHLTHEGRRANASSILSVMTLGAIQGAVIVIEASGTQAQEAADAMAALIDSGFGEMT